MLWWDPHLETGFSVRCSQGTASRFVESSTFICVKRGWPSKRTLGNSAIGKLFLRLMKEVRRDCLAKIHGQQDGPVLLGKLSRGEWSGD